MGAHISIVYLRIVIQIGSLPFFQWGVEPRDWVVLLRGQAGCVLTGVVRVSIPEACSLRSWAFDVTVRTVGPSLVAK